MISIWKKAVSLLLILDECQFVFLQINQIIVKENLNMFNKYSFSFQLWFLFFQSITCNGRNITYRIYDSNGMGESQNQSKISHVERRSQIILIFDLPILKHDMGRSCVKAKLIILKLIVQLIWTNVEMLLSRLFYLINLKCGPECATINYSFRTLPLKPLMVFNRSRSWHQEK